MPKRALDAEGESLLRRSLGVRGASDNAIFDLWHILRPEQQIGRGTFLRTVQDFLGPWKEMAQWHSFETHEGPPIHLPIMSLKELVKRVAEESQAFARALRAAQSFGSKLTPILYADEATAGNVLAVDKGRKAYLLYCSWTEFSHHLKNPNAWLCVAAIQTDALASIKGGMSAALVRILEQNITPEYEAGFMLNTPMGQLMFRQNQQPHFLGDAESIRAATSTKGSAGIRCCLHCSNVLKLDSNLTAFDDFFVEISASGGFVAAKDSEIFACADTLRRTRTKLERESSRRKALEKPMILTLFFFRSNETSYLQGVFAQTSCTPTFAMVLRHGKSLCGSNP